MEVNDRRDMRNIVNLCRKIERSESESPHRSIALPYISPKEGVQSLGGGFLVYLGPKGDYYGSRGVTTAKSGNLGELEISKLNEASQNPRIEACRYLRYHPQKVYKAWAEVSSSTWAPRATTMAHGGSQRQNLGF